MSAVSALTPPRLDASVSVQQPQAKPPAQEAIENLPEAPNPHLEGPLVTYIEQKDVIFAGLREELSKVRTLYPRLIALRERCHSLSLVLDQLIREKKGRTPEIDDEFIALKTEYGNVVKEQQTLKFELLKSHITNTLPAWQKEIPSTTGCTKESRVYCVYMMQQQSGQAAYVLQQEFNLVEAESRVNTFVVMAEITKLHTEIANKIAKTSLLSYPNKFFSSLDHCYEVDPEDAANSSFGWNVRLRMEEAETQWKGALDHLAKLRNSLQQLVKTFRYSLANNENANEVDYKSILEATEGHINALKANVLYCKKELRESREFKECEKQTCILGRNHSSVYDWILQVADEVEKRSDRLILQLQHAHLPFKQWYGLVLTLPPALKHAGPSIQLPRAYVLPVVLIDPNRPEPIPQASLLQSIAQQARKIFWWSTAEKIVPPLPIQWDSIQIGSCENSFTIQWLTAIDISPFYPLELPRKNLETKDVSTWTFEERWYWVLRDWKTVIDPLLVSAKDMNLAIDKMRFKYQLLEHSVPELKSRKSSPTLTGLKYWLEGLYWSVRTQTNELLEKTKLRKEPISVWYRFAKAFSEEVEAKIKNHDASNSSDGATRRKMQSTLEVCKLTLCLIEQELNGIARIEIMNQWLLDNRETFSSSENKPQDASESDVAFQIPTPLSFHGVIQDLINQQPYKQLLATPATLLSFEQAMRRLERAKLSRHHRELLSEKDSFEKLCGSLGDVSAALSYVERALESLTLLYENSKAPLDEREQKRMATQPSDAQGFFLKISDIQVFYLKIADEIEKYLKHQQTLKDYLEAKQKICLIKLSDKKINWRKQQADWLLRTAHGNASNIKRLLNEVGFYALVSRQLQTLREINEYKCSNIIKLTSEIYAKSEGRKVPNWLKNPFVVSPPPVSTDKGLQPPPAPHDNSLEDDPSNVLTWHMIENLCADEFVTIEKPPEPPPAAAAPA